jgi:hypothetical protein
MTSQQLLIIKNLQKQINGDSIIRLQKTRKYGFDNPDEIEKSFSSGKFASWSLPLWYFLPNSESWPLCYHVPRIHTENKMNIGVLIFFKLRFI